MTHRLTGLEAVDNVVVLDAGRVVEQSSHAGLIAQDGPYRRMWDANVPHLISAVPRRARGELGVE